MSYQSLSLTSADTVADADGLHVHLSQYEYLQGTWTPLHADVLRSYSWSTNITGRKHWKLLPPEYTHLLYDRFGR